jgi:hypothetical protein
VGPDPVRALVRRNHARGIEPDWRSGWPAYRHDGDIPWEIEAAALEAIDDVIDEALDEDQEAAIGGASDAA